MSQIQSLERISGKASQEATRLNSLLKNNGLITTQNEREEIGFIEDRVGKNMVDAVKTPSNITPQQILSTALRPLFTEGSYRSYEIEQDRKMAEAKGKARGFLQNTSRWVTSTVGKTFESTYMGIAHGAEAAINFGAKKIDKGLNWTAKKIGKEEWANSDISSYAGSDNMSSLMKLTGDIFSNTDRYSDEASIKNALKARIVSIVTGGRAGGVMGALGMLEGEGAQLALALSEFGPFNKNTDQVLEAVVNINESKFASKIDYVLDKLYKQIEVARFNEAQINGVEDSVEANLLSDIVEIQDKLKASGTTGARETFNFARFAAGLGLGTLTTTVNLVKTAAGSNLGENQRFQKIKVEVINSPEFVQIGQEIQEQVNAGTLSKDNAEKLLEQTLSKITYNTYLEVVKEAISVNKETTAKLTMTGFVGGVKSFINNAIDQGFAASNIKALAGYGISEQELQQLIIANKQEQANFKPEELGEAALALYKSVEKFSIIPTDGTQEFAEKIRKQQIEITDNGFAVAAKLGTEILKQTRDGAVAMVASTPYVAGVGALTYGATGGNFGFSVDRTDALSDFSGDRNIIQSRFDKGLGLNRGDMSFDKQFINAGLNIFGRANGSGNVYNALLMPFTALDNVTGRNAQIGISNGIENVKTAGSRVGEFSLRVAGSTSFEVTKAWNNSGYGKNGSDLVAAEPQSTKNSSAEGLRAQAGADVAKGGTFDFGDTKPGDKVVYGASYNGSSLEIPTTFLGKTGTTGTFRLDVNEALQRGYRISEATSDGKSYPVIIDSGGNIIDTIRTGYLLKEGTKERVLDSQGRFVPIIIEGAGKNGEVKGAQIDNKYASMTPADFAATKNSGGLQINDKTASAKPEAKPSSQTQPQTAPNSAKPTINFGSSQNTFGANSAAEGLLNRGARIDPDLQSGVNSNQFDQKPSTSGSSALEMLRQRTSTAANEVMATVQGTFVPQEKPVATNTAGGLTVDATRLQTGFRIPSSPELAVNLAENRGRAFSSEIYNKLSELKQESMTAVQNLAVAFNKNSNLVLDEATSKLPLGGGTYQSWADLFKKDPSSASNLANGIGINSIDNIQGKANFKGSMTFFLGPNMASGSAESTLTKDLSVLASSKITGLGGDVKISVPTIELGESQKSNVEVKNGIIKYTSPVFANVGGISQLKLDLPGGQSILITDPVTLAKLPNGVRLEDLVSSAVRSSPELAKSLGAIDLSKANSADLMIEGKNGEKKDIFVAMLNTANYYSSAKDASGATLQLNNVSPEVQDRRILGTFLDTAANNSKVGAAMLKEIKEFKDSGKYYATSEEVLKLTPRERAIWSLTRTLSPEILSKEIVTNLDFINEAKGKQFDNFEASQEALIGKPRQTIINNYTKLGMPIPEKLATPEDLKNAQYNLERRFVGKGGRPAWYNPVDVVVLDNIKDDIAIVQKARGMENSQSFNANSHGGGSFGLLQLVSTQEDTISFVNKEQISAENSTAFIEANKQNPKFKNIQNYAFSMIGIVPLEGVKLSSLEVKLIVAAASLFKAPLFGAYSLSRETIDTGSTVNLDTINNLNGTQQEKVAQLLAVTEIMKDPARAATYKNSLNNLQNTPFEAFKDALGADKDSKTAKWSIIGPKGRIEIGSDSELVEFVAKARKLNTIVEGEELKDGSPSTPTHKVFANSEKISVSTGGVVLEDNEKDNYLKQYSNEQVKITSDILSETKEGMRSNSAVYDSFRKAANVLMSESELIKAMGGNPDTDELLGAANYRTGIKNSVVEGGTKTNFLVNLNNIQAFKINVVKFVAPVMENCNNGGLYGIGKKPSLNLEGKQSVGNGEIGIAQVKRTQSIEQQTFAATANVQRLDEGKPPEKPKPPETKKETDLTSNRKVETAAPSVNAPKGANNAPQQTGGGVEVGKPTPAVTPGVKVLDVQGGTATNVNAAPVPSVTTGGNVQVDPSATNNAVQIPQASSTAAAVETAQSTSQATQVISQPASQAADTVTQTVNATQQATQQTIELTTTGGAILPNAPIIAAPQ